MPHVSIKIASLPALILGLCLALFCATPASAAGSKDDDAAPASSSPIPPSELPVKGKVNMLDLGADWCPPCKLMKPHLEQIRKEYGEVAVIAYIDVDDHRDQIARFGIKAVPTQIFFDARGNEVARHEGFWDADSMREKLAELGVEKPE